MRRRRRPPRLTAQERARRAARARRTLVPAAIEATGRRGFRETAARLEKYRDRITSPERLAGWLKGQAKAAGVLSPRHPYVGRRGYRKYPQAAARMTPTEYRAYLRRKRELGTVHKVGLQSLIKS